MVQLIAECRISDRLGRITSFIFCLPYLRTVQLHNNSERFRGEVFYRFKLHKILTIFFSQVDDMTYIVPSTTIFHAST
ncbi:hypothetical protein QVD17_38777 [Tagetes erecta]|uniref:Uncharacterized protein n=1 Tax=Tagetes erecta TaxID=13708 RepID=A0AAD8JMD8_TARER|nr:hypothetical protein QVD17_38777 [Tagetes erecta]